MKKKDVCLLITSMFLDCRLDIENENRAGNLSKKTRQDKTRQD